jgi:serine/threonine protein kinase/tetratricopeptide (TPR) repeat protein
MSQHQTLGGSSRHEVDPADPAPSFAEARGLKRELLEELRSRAALGQPIPPEDLLRRWPTAPQTDPDVASLLFEDYCQRQRQGERPSISDYEQRFPEHRDSLAGLFRQQGVLQSLGGVSGSGATLRLPDVGEELFGFHLRRELGRGAFARVLLAEQGDLADRPVVLKISAIEGQEPQTLAQLQHTHIVPIYSVHEDATAGLRAVCMPYFGGASLSRILHALWGAKARPTRGQDFVGALRAVQAPAWGRAADRPPSSALSTQQPAQPLPPTLEQSDYFRSVAWLIAHLADALQHAHERGVLHHDIKPSNILVSADGQPMLLDFNLAQDLHSHSAQATLGGTVAYMAPEHLRALAARDPALARKVNHQADIYGLGMVLYEMLTGHSPFDQSASYSPLPVLIEAMALERSRTLPSLRAGGAGRPPRPDIPWSLESITRRCLAPDAVARYQKASHLAEDLRAFLADLPMRHAPELSLVERSRKWLRRHPRLTSSASVAVVAGLLLLVAGAGSLGLWRQLATGEAQQRQQQYESGTMSALCLVNTSAAGPGREELGTGGILLDNTRRGLQVCEETLALYHVLDRPDWQQSSDWQRLSPNVRPRLAEGTRELLLLLAWARAQTHSGSKDELRQSLQLLDRAEAIEGLGPSPALLLDRAYYLDQLGEAERAEQVRTAAGQVQPHSARDHYLLATTYIRNYDHAEGASTRALAELDEAIRLEPHHYWSFLQKGIVHQERGEYVEAAGAFGVCIGLWPDFAWGHFNRGYAYMKCGRLSEAIADYTAALERDPGFLLAYLNRGATRLKLHQEKAALADFRIAEDWGFDDLALHSGCAAALEALGRPEESDAAWARAFARSEQDHGDGGASRRRALRLQYGFAVWQRLPSKAWEAFAQVLHQEPENKQALYGQALLARVREDFDTALERLNRAIEQDHDFIDALRARAILLARQGRFAEAEQDVNPCLKKEPTGGPTLYAAACVSAWLTQQWTKEGKSSVEVESAAQQALYFLKQSFRCGYGRDHAAQDPDLVGIRHHPQFRELLDAH